MCQVINIEAASCHIGSHEHRNHPIAKFLHHDVALLLRQVAVQGIGIIAV